MKVIKILAFAVAGLCTITSCHSQKKVTLGGEEDKHGCNSSTGETWSELSQSCIRLFDTALRLNPLDKKQGEAVISTFALFNKDKSKVELFLPNNTVILNKTAEQTYKDKVYLFNAREGELYIHGKFRYSTGKSCFDIISEVPYTISAGRFDETAQQLAHASGCFIETDLAKTGAIKVNAVSGKMSIREAIQMAIKGTKLQITGETADKIKVELIP
ncbi:MAG: hypothetical protein LRY55_07620 [Leadbetterella sp.]|nr:hypothetical protein [Leadbetterella sp.]